MRFRVPGAMQRAFALLRRTGTHAARAAGPNTGPGSAMHRSARAARCIASGARGTKKPALPPAFVAVCAALPRGAITSMRGFHRRLFLPCDGAFDRALHLLEGADLDL